ncbi:GTP cyclohydrolase II family protein [Clostridioides difficile P77]|nr:GTP cyclohydrolase II family protein [Clostridioides difficile]EQK39895.1 GTP cyclohydrolase II family protein [Clostridioides difficile P77]
MAAQILKNLNIKSINLLSNNPDKINQLEKYGIKIENRIPINEEINDFNKLYLKTKKDKMGHLLDII